MGSFVRAGNINKLAAHYNSGFANDKVCLSNFHLKLWFCLISVLKAHTKRKHWPVA